jgi:pyruvate/2-oxoglutarate dehydrogenase complex dihydrolipoamide dehydrogenase (E3) component
LPWAKLSIRISAAPPALELKEEGMIAVDRFSLETSRPGFYAGGDVITGASNVSNAMSGGKQAARKIDERLMGGNVIGEQRWETVVPAVRIQPAGAGRTKSSAAVTWHIQYLRKSRVSIHRKK